jgi:hypothetical protein
MSSFPIQLYIFLPAGQSKHWSSPSRGAYFPGEQAAGYVELTGHSEPAGHISPVPM